MTLTPRFALRSGRTCWTTPGPIGGEQIAPPDRVEIAIVGAGIMGAALAERLTTDGRQVAVFDRRAPAAGATAGSTALVLWAADLPLSRLREKIGFEDAAAAWRALWAANQALGERVAALGLDCGWTPRLDVYLSAEGLDETGLVLEGELRRAAGLPARVHAGPEIARRFGLPQRPGLVCDDVFAVDPVRLTQGLLSAAMQRDALLVAPVDVAQVRSKGSGLELTFADGSTTRAERAILATGYEAARAHLPAGFALRSSFAIATAPDQPAGWLEDAMVWEASDRYLYARRTAEGRIVLGGLDEQVIDPQARDRLLPTKRHALEAAAEGLLGRPLIADCAWTATFGTSPDGLPAIGQSQADERLWLAYGFGGNGITFAALAARLIARAFAGDADPLLGTLSPYRARAA